MTPLVWLFVVAVAFVAVVAIALVLATGKIDPSNEQVSDNWRDDLMRNRRELPPDR